MGNDPSPTGLHGEQFNAPEQKLELSVAQLCVTQGQPGIPLHARQQRSLGNIKDLGFLPAAQDRFQFSVGQQITDTEALPGRERAELDIFAVQGHGVDLYPPGQDQPYGGHAAGPVAEDMARRK